MESMIIRCDMIGGRRPAGGRSAAGVVPAGSGGEQGQGGRGRGGEEEGGGAVNQPVHDAGGAPEVREYHARGFQGGTHRTVSVHAT